MEEKLLQQIADNTTRMVALLEQVAASLAATPAPTPEKSKVEAAPPPPAPKPAPREPKLIPEAPAVPTAPAVLRDRATDFDTLKALATSDAWPEAVDPNLICGDASEQDKFDRAEGILDLHVDAHLLNLSVLDFGCGEGHLAVRALDQKPKKVVGYDVTDLYGKHQPVSSLIFTSDWNKVVEEGPYNVIVAYDVLDHIGPENGGVVEALRKLKQVLAPGGKAFVRTHPFCGRTGGHLYQQMNKAFLHLVFTEDELKALGLTPTYVRRVIHPLGTYQEWFTLAGFQQKHSQVSKEPVEAFFSDTPVIAKRVKANWRDSRDQKLRDGLQFPAMQMEQQFVDYVLG